MYFADVEKYYDPDLTIIDGSIDEANPNQNIISPQGNQQQFQIQSQFHQNFQNHASRTDMYNPQNMQCPSQGVPQNAGIPPHNIQDPNTNPMYNQPNQIQNTNNEDHKTLQSDLQQMNPNLMTPNQPYQQSFNQAKMYPNQSLTLPHIYGMQSQQMASQQMQPQQMVSQQMQPQQMVSQNKQSEQMAYQHMQSQQMAYYQQQQMYLH